MSSLAPLLPTALDLFRKHPNYAFAKTVPELHQLEKTMRVSKQAFCLIELGYQSPGPSKFWLFHETDGNPLSFKGTKVYCLKREQLFHSLDDLIRSIPVPEEAIGDIIQEFKCKGLWFRLSYEMILGLTGQRGLDHKIDLDTLQRCLAKKQDLFVKTATQEKEIIHDLYFLARESPRILNICVKYFPKGVDYCKRPEGIQFLIYTAYFMPSIVAKYRLNLLNELTFTAWRDQLPLIPKAKPDRQAPHLAGRDREVRASQAL